MRIQLINLDLVPVEYQAPFLRAARRLAKAVVGTATGRPKKIEITLKVVSIDGKDKVLAYAGPSYCQPNTCYAGTNDLPSKSEMVFDLNDLESLSKSKTLESTALHEMLHALGVGVHWESRGLITGSGTANPEYIGKHALREYQKLKRDETITGIPLENIGEEGTREAHWRQEMFGSEVFIGQITGKYQPLSRVTIGALEDLGYVVDYRQADPYSLPTMRRLEEEMPPAVNDETYESEETLTTRTPHGFTS